MTIKAPTPRTDEIAVLRSGARMEELARTLERELATSEARLKEARELLASLKGQLPFSVKANPLYRRIDAFLAAQEKP